MELGDQNLSTSSLKLYGIWVKSYIVCVCGGGGGVTPLGGCKSCATDGYY